MTAVNDQAEQPLKPPRIISGRLVVIGMFLLGVLGGTICVTYAIWRNAPYHDLTKALAAEFPKSVPKVEGGQHKGSPMTLRIVLNVAFPPGEEENAAQTEAAIQRVIELAKQHQDLTSYEVLQIHLLKKRPQTTISRTTVEFPVQELLSQPLSDAQ